MIDGTDWDVVVVGSGLGGLSTAALLANSGERVLVLEQGDGIGGLSHAFVRGDYVFDPAIHATSSGEITWNFLEYLGIDGDVPFTTSTHVYGAHIGDDISFVAPSGWDGFIEANTATVSPTEARELRTFFDLCRTTRKEFQFLPYRMDPRELPEIMAARPNFAKYRMATVGDVFDDHVPSPRARAVAGAAWPFLGVPPSRVSFLNYLQMLDTYIEGPRYPVGSFQRLADAFAGGIRRDGGQVHASTPVAAIHTDGTRVTGVRTEAGEEVTCRVVVSNADVRHTMLDLVSAEHLPDSYVKRIDRLKPSMSAVSVYAATDLDLTEYGLAHETFAHPSVDHDANWADIVAGRPSSAWMANTTLMDPGLAPPGEHTAIISSLAPWDIGRPWSEVKNDVGDALVALFDRVVPGLSSHLTYREVATPMTMHRFTRGYQGATYGWENTPRQFANKRLPYTTPLEGLFLAGHWTEAGPSSFRAIWSGISSSTLVLEWLGNDAAATLPKTFRERTGRVEPRRRATADIEGVTL